VVDIDVIKVGAFEIATSKARPPLPPPPVAEALNTFKNPANAPPLEIWFTRIAKRPVAPANHCPKTDPVTFLIVGVNRTNRLCVVSISGEAAAK
jgi:hypothetical protein